MLTAAALAAVVPTSPAAAASAVPAGTAVLLPGQPAALAVPADGRLDGYGITGQVLGVATATRVDGRPAGPGQVLWVIGVRWQVDQVTPPAGLSLSVLADGRTVPLPLPAGGATTADSGPRYWAVPEPTDASDVTLRATSGSFTQSFSLDHLRRSGPPAPALYRTPGQWRTVVPVDRTVRLALPPYLGFATAPLAVDLQAVTVTQFGPAGPADVPPAGAGAWLTVTITSHQTGDGSTYFYSRVSADQVTLTLPGQASQPATVVPGGGQDPAPARGAGSTGIFPDRYAFRVPADVTTATLTVHPTQISEGDVIHPTGTVDLAATSFALTVPAPTSPAPAADAAATPRRYGAIGTVAALPARAGTAGRSSGSPAVAWIVAALVVLVATAVILWRRRQPAVTVPVPAWTTITPQAGPAPPWGPQPTAGAPPETQATPAAPPSASASQVPAPATAPPPSERPGRQSVTPDASRPASDGGLSSPFVAVMGPVGVEGWAAGAPRRTAVVDLVVFLACHPDRPVSTDRLRAALSGPAGDISDETLHTYVSLARRALGADRVPPATERGYRLDGVDCDWTRFQHLTAMAAGADQERACALLDQAVGLARGRSFPDGSRWAELEGIPAAIDHAVVTAAARCADLHLDARRPERAEWAAAIGLEIAPTDEALGIALLRAGAATAHLATAWTRITAGWADADLPVPASLTDLRRQLATGH